MTPGSLPWLLGFEMKLIWRGRNRRTAYTLVIALVAILVVGGVIGLPLGYWLRHRMLGVTPLVAMIADVGFLVVFTLLLSQTLSATVMAFYQRGDLDLLLSSPVPARRILLVRCLAIVLNPLILFGALATPAVLPLAILGHPGLLGIYGMLVALAFGAAACGLILAMALFAAIGARRTKTVGQLLAAFSGASIFLLFQTRNIFPEAGRAVMLWLQGAGAARLFAFDSPLAWPARAAIGEPWPVISILFGSAFFFAAAAQFLGARFAVNAAIASGVEATPARRRVGAQTFRNGLLRVMIAKELRLLWRDPALLSQVVLRALYMVPLLFVSIRNAHHHLLAALAMSAAILVFVTSQVSATLTWITINAEDAPELIATAPVALYRARIAKLAAALIPVAALVAVPILFLLAIMPWAGIIALLGVATVSAATGALNLWYERPGKRGAMRQRSSGSVLVAIGEILIGMLGGGATGLAAYGSLWGLLPAAILGGVMVIAYEGRSRAS